jgi:large subunit ribosomal protein L17
MNIISDWGWLLIILLVILVVAWRLIANRSREEFHVDHPAEHETRMVSEASIQAPAAPAQVDDLAIIEGIGPKISSLLQSAGISTFAQLAETDLSQLQEILRNANLRIADPTTWPEQARLAAGGNWDDLNALQGRLRAGRQ